MFEATGINIWLPDYHKWYDLLTEINRNLIITSKVIREKTQTDRLVIDYALLIKMDLHRKRNYLTFTKRHNFLKLRVDWLTCHHGLVRSLVAEEISKFVLVSKYLLLEEIIYRT
jgi:hypothetical protein